MRFVMSLIGTLLLFSLAASVQASGETLVKNSPSENRCPAVLNYEFKRLNSDEKVNLCDAFYGQLILVVNTASQCAFTPQYEGLEALYRQYGEDGFVVLGFPSNNFAGQEPGTEAQIKDFCQVTYNVEFPMFEKVDVTPKQAHPFYQHLAKLSQSEYPGWNFHKYLISPKGELITSFKSHVKPQSQEVINTIQANLPKVF